MADKKVSVIIPIYNGEKFLEKSLLILTEQTLDDIEFVCVNDASTDGSLNILKAFKEVFTDKFVIVNSEKNGGPGGARSIGLSYARGEYIGFIDQDDYVREMMYENMYNEAKSGDYDIVACNYFDRAINGAYEMENWGGFLNYGKRRELLKVCYVWNKIFKRTLVDDMSMGFRKNVIRDDTDFTVEAVMRAKRGLIIPDVYYIYNNVQESTSRTKNIDLHKEYREISSLIKSMDNRTADLDNKEDAAKFIQEYILVAIKSALRFIFEKDEFTYSDFLDWHNFACNLLPGYSKYKNETSEEIEDIVFCKLMDNLETSFENLVQLHEYLISRK